MPGTNTLTVTIELKASSVPYAVRVEELVKGGRAEKAGVQVGDILLEVSAVTLVAGKEGQYAQNGYGDRPFDNFNRAMMSCVGQDFDTVMNVRSVSVLSLCCHPVFNNFVLGQHELLSSPCVKKPYML